MLCEQDWHGGDELLDVVLVDGEDQVLAGGEVAIEGACADARAFGDRVQ